MTSEPQKHMSFDEQEDAYADLTEPLQSWNWDGGEAFVRRKLRALDLFCGAGGASMGLHRAGFDVTGVDIKRQPRYPFRFVQADALAPPFDLSRFDFIWASPPCQGYSIMRNLPWLRNKVYPLLIEPIREMLIASGAPWVIENVMGAHLPAGWLCGGMFGLPFFRHRAFECNFPWLQPGHPPHRHTVRNGRTCGSRARDIVHNGARRLGANVGHAAGVALAREAMDVPWMSREEITQAVPPAYSEFIGRAFLAQYRESAA
jgi:DNA (cytosine-5)-methyltransferase 1